MQNAECGMKRRTLHGKLRLSMRSLSLFIIHHSSLIILFLLFLLSGCITGKSNPAATQPVTYIPQIEATQDYWWKQPGVTDITSDSFQKLWDACEGELYVRLFPIDRTQYRDGVLTSEPVVSKQFFELWRTDAVSVHDVAESSLATIRRTIQFAITRREDGTYQAVPKVLVERYASTERRLTNITQYHQAFTGGRIDTNPDQAGSTASGSDYWYPLRRDTDLEKDLAASIRQRLRG
jgi:hypothetical protein